MKAGKEKNGKRRTAAARWLLDNLLPEDSDAINGDISETYDLLREREGERIADERFRREVVQTLMRIGFARLARRRLTAFSILAGAFAGAAAIAFGPRGARMLLSYVGLMVVVSLYLSATRSYSFRDRMAAATGAFMTMTFIVYVFLMITSPRTGVIPLEGHIWRLGLMFLIGSFLGSVIGLASGDSITAKFALPAIFLPWPSYGYWLVARCPYENFPTLLKVLLPYEACTIFLDRHPAGLWVSIAVNTAVWTSLALLAGWYASQRSARMSE